MTPELVVVIAAFAVFACGAIGVIYRNEAKVDVDDAREIVG